MTRFLGSGWKRLWVEGNTPWDLGGPTPLLQWFLKEHSSLFKQSSTGGNILVPGCGSGWDLSVLKNYFPESNVIGMDISEQAIEIAKRNNPQCTLEQGDFFTSKLPLIHLIYDHTFFCALKPAMREEWGKQMSRLIINEGCLLVIAYPQTNADLLNGPPFLVKFSDYQNALRDNFRLVFQATLPPALPNHPKRNAQNELIALFQKCDH